MPFRTVQLPCGRMKFALAGVVACFALGGCDSVTSTVEYSRVSDPQNNAPTGIPYYQSAPYLLIYSDGMGGLKWQLLSLPDQTKMMQVLPKPASIGGKTQLSLNFSYGTLSTAATGADSTQVPATILAAVQAAIPAIAAARVGETLLNAPAPPALASQVPPHYSAGFPPPYLYKIVLEADGSIQFLGGPGNESIKVPGAVVPRPTPPQNGGTP